MGRSLKVERRGLGVARIMSWTWSGRANDKAFKFQFPLASQQSLTFAGVKNVKRALDEVSERTMTEPVVIPEVGCFAIFDNPTATFITNGFGF